MTLQFNGPTLSTELKCQAPIIHFQPDAQGVTLRASEVKPKLDRFISKKMRTLPREWRVAPSGDALKYKMKFEDKKPRIEDIPNGSLYYGGGNKRFVWTNPKLVITCFIPELQQAILDYLEDFFIVTNFGTMQGKGFGSFLVKDSAKNSPLTLMKEFDLQEIHRVETCTDFSKQQLFIKQFYTLTKSGNNSGSPKEYKRSALFTYMHKKGIDNEKAYLKQEGIMEAVGTYQPAQIVYKSNPKYVRIVLGQAFLLTVRERNGRRGVLDKVGIKNSEIQRFASPLIFKIINNFIYIIPKELPKEIFNRDYTFINKQQKRSCTLKTPESFDLKDFTNYAVDYYNTEGPSAFSRSYHKIKTYARSGGNK